jgi:hypothetical protein
MCGFVSAPTHCDHDPFLLYIGNKAVLEHMDECSIIIVSLQEFAIRPFYGTPIQDDWMESILGRDDDTKSGGVG